MQFCFRIIKMIYGHWKLLLTYCMCMYKKDVYYAWIYNIFHITSSGCAIIQFTKERRLDKSFYVICWQYKKSNSYWCHSPPIRTDRSYLWMASRWDPPLWRHGQPEVHWCRMRTHHSRFLWREKQLNWAYFKIA